MRLAGRILRCCRAAILLAATAAPAAGFAEERPPGTAAPVPVSTGKAHQARPSKVDPNPDAAPAIVSRTIEATSPVLAQLPEKIRLAERARLVLELPERVTFLTAGEGFLKVDRVEGGLQLTGLQSGQTVLFLADGAATRILPVLVERSAGSLSGPARSPRVPDFDRPARVTTGGWIKRWMIEGQKLVAKDGAGAAETGRIDLQGNASGVTYRLRGTRTIRAGQPAVESQARVSGSGWTVAFERAGAGADFLPIALSSPIREAQALGRLGPLQLELGARGPYTSAMYLFRPQALRLASTYRLGDARAVAGVLGARPYGELSLLPFLGTDYRTPRLDVGVTVGGGRLEDGAWTVPVSGRLSGVLGPCRAGARWARRLGKGDASPFSAYVAGGKGQLFASGGCQVSEAWSFDLGARMGDPSVASGALLATGLVSYQDREEGLGLSLRGQWAGGGGPSYAALSGTLALSEEWMASAVLGASAGGSSPLTPSESLAARYSREGLSVDLSAGLMHTGLAPARLSTGAAARLSLGLVRLEGAVTAALGIAEERMVGTYLRAGVDLTPAPAYSLRLTATADPFFSGHWSVLGTVAYAFGDDLPREPLLAPFRASTIHVTVFEDSDGDGTRDEGEPGLAGVMVCLDATDCHPTGADGGWTREAVPEGFHDLMVDVTRSPGFFPTSPPGERVLVGGFRAPRREIGLRRQGFLTVRAFLDEDGDGARGPGEPAFTRVTATVNGPRFTSAHPLAKGEVEVPFYEPGAYQVDVDFSRLPEGYLAPDQPLVVQAKDYGRYLAELPIRAIRSISGRVCVDTNKNSRCDPGERGVGGVRVAIAGREAPTDPAGDFLLSMLPAGAFALTVRPESLPGGLVHAETIQVRLFEPPQSVTGLSVALWPLGRARRPVRVDWPGKGMVQAVELAGHFMSAAGLWPPPGPRRPEPGPEDARAIARLVPLLKDNATLLFVTVHRDPGGQARDPEQAERDARRIGANLLLYLAREHKVVPSQVVLRTAPASGPVPMVDLRVCKLSEDKQ